MDVEFELKERDSGEGKEEVEVELKEENFSQGEEEVDFKEGEAEVELNEENWDKEVPSSSSSSSSSAAAAFSLPSSSSSPSCEYELEEPKMFGSDPETKNVPFPFASGDEAEGEEEEEEEEGEESEKEKRRKKKRMTQKHLRMRNLRKEPKVTVLPKRISQFFLLYLFVIFSLLLTVIILAMVYDYGDDDDGGSKPPVVLNPTLTFPLNALYVGHINPSTDSYCSAMAGAFLYSGRFALAGDPSPETQYVINRFDLVQPPSFSNEYESSSLVVLVDHNQRLQSPPFIGFSFPPNISGIIDHHGQQEGFVASPNPLVVDIRAWGSSATILYYHYLKNRLTPSKSIAQCLLSAILSDTVGLKGPTTTGYDVNAANSLNAIAKVGSLSKLTTDLINSRVPDSSTSISDILNLDAKTYRLSWKDGSVLTLRWSTFESGDPDFILDRQNDFIKEMRNQKKEFSLDFYFMSVVDELNFFYGSQDSYSWLLLPSRDEIIIATQAFGTEARFREITQMEVTPLISRTKEFLPPVVDYLRERDPFDWGDDALSIGLATDDL